MKIRCNNCMRVFDEEEDLEMIDEGEGYFFLGCPECKTDEYLMDLEVNDNENI